MVRLCGVFRNRMITSKRDGISTIAQLLNYSICYQGDACVVKPTSLALMAQEKAFFLHVLCARITRNLHAIFAGTPQLDRIRARITQKAQDVVGRAR